MLLKTALVDLVVAAVLAESLVGPVLHDSILVRLILSLRSN